MGPAWPCVVGYSGISGGCAPQAPPSDSGPAFQTLIWGTHLAFQSFWSDTRVSALQTQKKLDCGAAWFYLRTILHMATL